MKQAYYIHPREWLSIENDILFAPGDTVFGELIKRGDRFYVDCDNGEEPIEVLNPNGAYVNILKRCLGLVDQTKED